MDNAIQSILQKNNISLADNSSTNDQIQAVFKKNGIDQNAAIGALGAIGDQSDNGMCQRFVEKQLTGRTGLYSSATKAYQDQASKGNVNTDFSQMQPGDAVYFEDPNQPDGHVGIVDGPDSMVSATYNGVQPSKISDWLKSTGQRPLGFIRGYK
jgi:cell wall-associated NlpC family hydrolase